MKFNFKIFTNKNDSKELRQKVTSKLILDAYDSRKEEIESLRKYDRGEKTITPSSLKRLVSSL